jgi:hypothetical protein
MSQNEVAISRELKEFIEIEFANLKESCIKYFTANLIAATYRSSQGKFRFQ